MYFKWKNFDWQPYLVSRIELSPCTVPKILFMCSQKWNWAASFPIPTFMYLWVIYVFPVWVCIFGCSKDSSWDYINRSQIHECENWETEHYNSVLEIMRPRSFIFENTSIGTRLLYWDSHQPFICNVWATRTEPTYCSYSYSNWSSCFYATKLIPIYIVRSAWTMSPAHHM